MTRIPALGPRGEGWVAAQVVLFMVIAVTGALNLQADTPQLGGWLIRAVGVGLMLVGGWVVARGLQDLGTNLTALPYPVDQATLVRHGLYARVRHPVYAGVIGLGLGWALVTLSLPALAAAGVLVVVLDLKSRREEVWLEARFPDYPEYRRTAARFLPGVY